MSSLPYLRHGQSIKLPRDTRTTTTPTPRNLHISGQASTSRLHHNNEYHHHMTRTQVISNTHPSRTSPIPRPRMPSLRSTIRHDNSSNNNSGNTGMVKDAGGIVEVAAVMAGTAAGPGPSLSTSPGPRSPSLAASPGFWSTLSTAADSPTTRPRTRATGASPRRS